MFIRNDEYEEEKLFETSSDLSLEPVLNIKLCTKSSHGNRVDVAKLPTKCSRRFSVRACNVLNSLRINNQLCDGIIKVDDGTEFLIHRAILSASSRYFYALFTNGLNDTLNKTIEIKEVESEVMKRVIGNYFGVVMPSLCGNSYF